VAQQLLAVNEEIRLENPAHLIDVLAIYAAMLG
jgi:hypothetical protein